MPAPHILIAGAGIGGLTVAIALARRGIAVTVAEQRTGFGETGAGLQISPNAGRILESLDLKLALKRASVVPERLVVRRWRDGATLTQMPMTTVPGETPFRVLKRTDLHMLLLDAARALPNLRLIVGRGVADVVEDDHGITATLVNGAGQAETIESIAVIGADGLHSRLRILSGDTAAPVFTGYEAWRTLVPHDGPPVPAEIGLHLGAGHHAVHYPVAGGREINLVIVRAATQAREGWSREGDAADIIREVADASPALRGLAGRAPNWLVWSLFDRPPAVMGRGRIALLGDAAHPVLPFLAQGAALAIEDAAVLTQELVRHIERDGAQAVPAALQAYAAARAKRTARMQQASRKNGGTYHLGRPWSLGRDLVMRRLGPDGLRARHAWVYDWRATP